MNGIPVDTGIFASDMAVLWRRAGQGSATAPWLAWFPGVPGAKFLWENLEWAPQSQNESNEGLLLGGTFNLPEDRELLRGVDTRRQAQPLF